MTYSNYVNTGHATLGYTNSIGYYNSGGSSFGYYATTALSYTNYCNAKHTAPTSNSVSAATTPFSQYAVADGSDVLAQITKLKTDLQNLSVNKVAKSGSSSTTPILYTPSFTSNVDANFDLGDKLDNNQIEEMTAQVKALWQSIKGEEGSGWPTSPADNNVALSADYTSLVEKAELLANDMNSGYLNCCNVTGTAGYGYAAAGTYLGTYKPVAGTANASVTHAYSNATEPTNLNSYSA
jgi:hypothetical protein